MTSDKKRPRFDVVPRGLSRIQSAAYIGISTTFFDQLVADGRMPHPKRINTRKVWDRWAIDAAFDDLPDDDESKLETELERWEVGNDTSRPKADSEAKFWADAVGFDPRGISKEEHAAAWERHVAEWRAAVRLEPLNKRERLALSAGYERRGRLISYDEVKGVGGGTLDRLEARGFVLVSKDETRLYGWRMTSDGEAAYHSIRQT